MRSVTIWSGGLGRQGIVECDVVVKDMARQAWYGRVRLGEVGCGKVFSGRQGAVGCGLVRCIQVRWGMVRQVRWGVMG